MQCQDLPFLEKFAGADPLWHHITEEQKNVSISHRNMFYNDIKCKYCIIPETE